MRAHVGPDRTRLRVIVVAILVCLAVPAYGQGENSEPPDDSSARSFTVGIEDVLRVVVWNEPELSGSVTVRPDGMITIPLIHDLQVDGMTPAEIGEEITQKLSQYVRDPNVTVVVEKINSFRIYFVGEVNQRGAIQFYRPVRVLQAVAMAGGPTEFSKRVITVLREENGVEKRIQIDYKKLLDGALGQENIYLKPGDTLIFK